jgi:hypothetical protein
VFLAPVPWVFECALPYAYAGSLGCLLISGVGALRVTRPIEGMAVSCHPSGHALPICSEAVAYKTLISVAIYELATSGARGSQKQVKSLGGSFPTSVGSVGSVRTGLPALRSIYAIQANPFVLNVDSVAIDYGGSADRRPFTRCGRGCEYGYDRQAKSSQYRNPGLLDDALVSCSMHVPKIA